MKTINAILMLPNSITYFFKWI